MHAKELGTGYLNRVCGDKPVRSGCKGVAGWTISDVLLLLLE